MPLTQHLYELDEVVSAARVCLRNNWPRALFFIWELVVSGEEAEAYAACQETWLEYGGGWDPTMMSVALPKTGEGWSSLVARVREACSAASDLTVWRFMSATVEMRTAPVLTTPPKPIASADARAAGWVAKLHPDEQMDRETATSWFKGLLEATQAGVRAVACWHLQAALPVLSSDAIWHALALVAIGPEVRGAVTGLQASASTHPWRQAMHQAAAILILCASEETRVAMLKSRETVGTGSLYAKDWVAWNANLGRRVARVYPIPVDALHRGTTRGSLSTRFTNIDEIREPCALLLEGCPCWREAAITAGATIDPRTGGLMFPDDDMKEAFMDHHFPDDWPDEWSAADQQKSHGRGCAETAAAPPIMTPIREF
jgi:hypothetical protein